MSVDRSIRILAALLLLSSTSFADLVGSDNADNDPYPLGWNPGDNAGIGFKGWTVLDSGSPGSMYIDSTSELEGGYSWGESGTFALGRGLSNSLPSGYWSFLARHDMDNTAFSGFNLRTSTNIGSGFDSSELIRFGLDAGVMGYDNTGVYISTNAGADYSFLDLGDEDIRTAILLYTIHWDTSLGSYSLTVSNTDVGTTATLNGALASGSSVAMLGMGIFGVDTDERLTFDSFGVAIPEPGTLVAVGLGALLLFSRRRR